MPIERAERRLESDFKALHRRTRAILEPTDLPAAFRDAAGAFSVRRHVCQRVGWNQGTWQAGGSVGTVVRLPKRERLDVFEEQREREERVSGKIPLGRQVERDGSRRIQEGVLVRDHKATAVDGAP